MIRDNTTDRWFDFRLDVAGAALGLVLGLLLLPLRFLASQVYINLLPIALTLACGTYLLSVRSDRDAAVPQLSQRATRALPSVTVFGMAAMVVVATLQARSTLFLYLAVWTGVAILAQVLFGDDRDYHVGLLLAQIVAFAAIVRLAGAYTSPGFVGIDVYTPVAHWARAVDATHSLAPMRDRKYYASPLFHLIVVAASQFGATTIRQGLLLSVGLAMPLSVLLVYATANLLVTPRWAVFAAAAFAMSGDSIEWGIHLIPTSLGLLFFAAILYGLTRLLYMSYAPRDFLLVVLFSVAVILTHQISAFIMLVFIGAGLTAKLLLETGLLAPQRPRGLGASARESVSLSGLLAFDVGLSTVMWSLTPYRGSTFLETMVSYFTEAVSSSAGFLNLAGPSGGGGGGAAGGAGRTLLESVVAHVDAAGFLLLLFLAIVGSLYLLHREHTSHAAVTSIVSIVVMLVFIFGLPLFGIRTFVPGRWFAFVTAPMAVVGAVGVGYLAEFSPKTVAVVILLALTVAYPATTLVSSDATLDDPAFASVQTRYSYTEPELAAVRTLANVTNTSRTNRLATDHPYNTVFQRWKGVNTEAALVRNGSTPNGTVVYREYDRSGTAYFVGADGRAHQPAVTKRQLCLGRDVAYDDGAVSLCRSGVGPVYTGTAR